MINGEKKTHLTFGRRSAISITGLTRKSFDTEGFHTFPLSAPIRSPVIRDVSVSGHVNFVSLWEGDPGQGGKLIRTYVLTPADGDTGFSAPTDGSWPATHASLNVFAPTIGSAPISATVEITGTPEVDVPIGVDVSFLYHYPSDPATAGSRPAAQRFIDQIYPSLSFVQGIAPRVLSYINRDTDKLIFEMPLYGAVDLGDRVSGLGVSGIVTSISHSDPGAGSAPTTTVEAAVV